MSLRWGLLAGKKSVRPRKCTNNIKGARFSTQAPTTDQRNYNDKVLREQRKRAEKWYWENRLPIASKYFHKAVLVEEGKVLRSFDSLLEADEYQLKHYPGMFPCYLKLR